jgi:hypothetical protein
VSGFLSIGQRHALMGVNCHGGEDAILVAPVDEVRIGTGGSIVQIFRSDFKVVEGQYDKLLWPGERQRAEQDRVNDAKDGGIGSDSERQSKNDNRAEKRLFDQRAHGMAEITHIHLLRTQSLDRIELRSAPGGEKTGEQGDGSEQAHGSGELF